MQSLIVYNFHKTDAHRYSNLRVLRDTSGYYIGTLYTGVDGSQRPGTRDSVETFPKAEQAARALEIQSFTTRLKP